MRAYLTTDQQHGIPCFLKRGPLPDWPIWTREQMIRGDAAEREDIKDEAERDKPNGTQPAPDKREQAPSGALSQEHASNKGDKAPTRPATWIRRHFMSSNDPVPSAHRILPNLTKHTATHSQKTKNLHFPSFLEILTFFAYF